MIFNCNANIVTQRKIPCDLFSDGPSSWKPFLEASLPSHPISRWHGSTSSEPPEGCCAMDEDKQDTRKLGLLQSQCSWWSL